MHTLQGPSESTQDCLQLQLLFAGRTGKEKGLLSCSIHISAWMQYLLRNTLGDHVL